MTGRVTLVEGDITDHEVDAIINAANSELVLGSGVAGAIAARGGPSIQQACTAHGPISVGEAAATDGGDLPARYVLHAASMPPGGAATEDTVRSSFRHALVLAEERACKTVAAPAIGAGVAGVALQRVAEVLIEEARRHVDEEGHGLEEIRFVLFGEPAYRVFEMVNDAAKVAAQMERLERARNR